MGGTPPHAQYRFLLQTGQISDPAGQAGYNDPNILSISGIISQHPEFRRMRQHTKPLPIGEYVYSDWRAIEPFEP